MIESSYWKEILLQNEKALKPLKLPFRWSGRRARILERDLSICFFIIRKLIELHRVSRKTLSYKMIVFACKAKGNPTLLNLHKIEKLYALDGEIERGCSLGFISNQFIHSYIIFPYLKKDRNWGGVYICSDFERNKYIYRISIEEIRSAFKVVGKDYPTKMS